MATIENVADMLFSGLTSVAMGSYARTPPQAERTQSHRPQRGELLAEPALNVAGSISFRFHVVCVSYNTHALQGFSSRTVSLSPHTKRQATSTQRQQKNWGWARRKDKDRCHQKFQTNGTVGPFTIPKRECYVWGYQPRTRPEGICPVSLPETC